MEYCCKTLKSAATNAGLIEFSKVGGRIVLKNRSDKYRRMLVSIYYCPFCGTKIKAQQDQDNGL
jgi:hypothetical protein